MQRNLITLVLLFIAITASAQEYLIDAAGIYSRKLEKTIRAVQTNDTLKPPLFDDFSYYQSAPDENLWVNGGVYVNYTYPIGPPSVGVATFDAVDLEGKVYEHLSTSPLKSDALTTNPIWIESTQINSTYITFYYQPQGYGDAPEFNDSLVLRVIGNELDTVIWRAHGCEYSVFNADSLNNDPEKADTTLNFKLVHIPLNNNLFFDRLIQLQFENYVSLTGDHAPSEKTNSDHWNIDYFNLRDNVTAADTSFPDIALVKPFDFFLKKFSSVPWSHYNAIINDQLTSADNYIRNLHNQSISTELIRLYVYDNSGTLIDTFSSQQTLELPPFSYNEGRTWKTVEPIRYDNQDNAQFLFEGKIFSELGEDFQQNNSVFRYYNFANYYSRDDGSAEKAYGVDVNGAQIAYKYKTYVKDTLTAIRFHFEDNQDPNNIVESFKLCVWEGSEDEIPPGTLLRLEEGQDSVWTDGLNGFKTYTLAEPIALEGDFFIGWEQTSDLMMNVGFDANTINNNKRLYYRVYDNWYESAYNGSGALMMHPVFGDVTNTSIFKEQAKNSFSLYPNPSSGMVYLNSAVRAIDKVEVFNSLGALVYKASGDIQQIDLSHIRNGIYLIKITDKKNFTEIHKILLSN